MEPIMWEKLVTDISKQFEEIFVKGKAKAEAKAETQNPPVAGAESQAVDSGKE